MTSLLPFSFFFSVFRIYFLRGSLIGGTLGGTAVALLNEIFVLSHKGGNGDDTREIGARIVAGFLLFLFSFLLAFCSQNYLLIRRSALSTLALALLSSVSQNFDPEAAFTFVEYVFYDSAVAAGYALTLLFSSSLLLLLPLLLYFLFFPSALLQDPSFAVWRLVCLFYLGLELLAHNSYFF
jgi:hypothetical protein